MPELAHHAVSIGTSGSGLRTETTLTVSGRSLALASWLRLGAEFLVGQTAVQVLNLLAGFVLLRWLTTEHYAQFSFTSGLQAMLTVLLDLGSAGAIVALVGARTADPAVVGRYVAAAKDLRRRLALIVVPVGAVLFLLAGRKHDWSYATRALLLGSLVAAVFVQGNVGIYSAPLLMHRRLALWYRGGMLAGAGRLLAFVLLQAASALSGWVTSWVNTLAAGVTAMYYRRASVGFVVETDVDTAGARRELLRYLAPLIPGVAFTAFQGQITVFLVTVFGQTENIAEVAALGRLGQVFALLAAFNGVILQPHMAALARERVFARYAGMLVIAILISGALCLIGWMWPSPLLWLLGVNYSHLTHELRWLLVASSLQYVASVMWAVHSARKWIYWWGTFSFIGGTVAVQAVVMATHDLSTTQAAMEFAVWSSLVPLAVHVLTAAYAFARGK